MTPTDQGPDAETAWPERTDNAAGCADGDAFYIDAAAAVPKVALCAELCAALVERGVGSVKLELIYGCEPPE